MGLKSALRLMRTLGPSLASLPNLLGVFYPMPLRGRIASRHDHGFLCGALRGNVTSPKTFEAFNVAIPFLGTSLRGGFLYGLTLIFLGF